MGKFDKILSNFRGEYKFNYPLSHLTWFKVGGPAELLLKPDDTLDLLTVIQNNEYNIPITCIGAGSNIIIRDGGIKGIIIKLGNKFTNIEKISTNELVAASGCLNANLASFCLANSISGFEFLAGIPGAVAGGVIMNAGAYGCEFKDIVLSIEAVDVFGSIIEIPNEEIGFKYRGNNLDKNLIVTKVIFKTKPGEYNSIKALMDSISAQRSATQPIHMRTGGSTFKNPHHIKAWELIDKAGLRGYSIGNATISDLHCNFMVNRGGATAHDLESLGEFVRQKVYDLSGIKLEWEIKIIGIP